MFPIFLIAIGLAVLAFGKRLAVLGAAVGALLGIALLRLIPGISSPLLSLLIPILLAVIGFLVAGFAKGMIGIVLTVLGALAGAAIMLVFLNLLNVDTGMLDWLLVLIGGIAGVILVGRFKEWAMIILSGLIGGLLVTRGLGDWFPILQGTLGSLLALVLAGAGILYQSRR